ncbi:Uncharacterized protein APZ42_002535, partial [Daphnia magna]
LYSAHKGEIGGPIYPAAQAGRNVTSQLHYLRFTEDGKSARTLSVRKVYTKETPT